MRVQKNMRTAITAITLTTALLASGCTRTYKSVSYYDPNTGNYITNIKEITDDTSEKETVKGSFEEILAHHKYTVFKKYGETKNPVRIIADTEHTPENQRKNNALLKNFLKKEDLLLVEGHRSSIIYPDLEERLFTALKTPKKSREAFKKIAQGTTTKDNCGYFDQEFPCTIESSEDDVLAYVCNAIYQDFEEIETPTTQQEHTIVYAFNQSLHYRNLAMARTITQKQKENPARQIYKVVGAHHVITNAELKKLGGIRPDFVEEFSGELCKLLEEEKIPYIVIIPTDFDY